MDTKPVACDDGLEDAPNLLKIKMLKSKLKLNVFKK